MFSIDNDWKINYFEWTLELFKWVGGWWLVVGGRWLTGGQLKESRLVGGWSPGVGGL